MRIHRRHALSLVPSLFLLVSHKLPSSQQISAPPPLRPLFFPYRIIFLFAPRQPPLAPPAGIQHRQNATETHRHHDSCIGSLHFHHGISSHPKSSGRFVQTGLPFLTLIVPTYSSHPSIIRITIFNHHHHHPFFYSFFFPLLLDHLMLPHLYSIPPPTSLPL